jgi:hypothetical protein
VRRLLIAPRPLFQPRQPFIRRVAEQPKSIFHLLRLLLRHQRQATTQRRLLLQQKLPRSRPRPQRRCKTARACASRACRRSRCTMDEQVLFAVASIRRAGDGMLQSTPATWDLLSKYRSTRPTSRLCLLSTLMCLSVRRRRRRRLPCATHQQKRCSRALTCASMACRLHRR